MGSGVKCRVKEINLNREGQSKADRVVLEAGPIPWYTERHEV